MWDLGSLIPRLNQLLVKVQRFKHGSQSILLLESER